MVDRDPQNEQNNVSEEEEVMSEHAERLIELNGKLGYDVILAHVNRMNEIMEENAANRAENANALMKAYLTHLDNSNKAYVERREQENKLYHENNRYTLNALYGFSPEEMVSISTILKALEAAGVITINKEK